MFFCNSERETGFAAEVATKISGPAAVDTNCPAIMGAEDFAYVLEKVPGAMFFLGFAQTAGKHYLELSIRMVLGAAFVFAAPRMAGSAAVGLYSIGLKYLDGLNIIPSMFTMAIFPLMSRFARSERNNLLLCRRLGRSRNSGHCEGCSGGEQHAGPHREGFRVHGRVLDSCG